MAYIPPDHATFIGIFPALAAVTEDQYAFWSAQAVLITEPIEGCLDARMDLATMLVTAHLLTLQGIGTGAEAEMASQGAGSFKRIKSGTLELERGDASSGGEGGLYATTDYGRQVWPMLKGCLSGPRVTGTGAMGCGCGGFRSGPLPWQ